MTDDHRGEDEFKRLLRDSIDSRGTDWATGSDSWGEQEDVYTPSTPLSADATKSEQEHSRKQSDGDQEWNQNIGGAVYALKDQQAAAGDDTAADSLSLSLSEEAKGKGSDAKGQPVSRKQSGARQSAPSQLGRTVNWGLRLVAAVAVVVLAAWFVLRDQQGHSRLSRVEQRLDSLQQQVAGFENDAADRERMNHRLADVETAIAELSREGPSLQLPEAAISLVEDALQRRLLEQNRQLERFASQLTELEKELSSLRKVSAGSSRVVSDTGGNMQDAGKAASGRWSINIMTVTHASYAARLLARYRKTGIDAEQLEIKRNGKRMYRLRVSGFPTKAAAEDYEGEVRSKLGLKDTWVTSP